MQNLRNKPHYAVDKEVADSKGFLIPEHAVISVSRWKYDEEVIPLFGLDNTQQEYLLIPAAEKRILYDGRYCAVAAFIFAVVDGKVSVLANQRGQGTPDFQGCWNCPCGFLERNEFGYDDAARETFEECGFKVEGKSLKMVGVQTDPVKSNNGNVTIRYRKIIWKKLTSSELKIADRGGEENEVTNIRWIPINEIDNYQWAFGHESTIRKVMPSKFLQILMKISALF